MPKAVIAEAKFYVLQTTIVIILKRKKEKERKKHHNYDLLVCLLTNSFVCVFTSKTHAYLKRQFNARHLIVANVMEVGKVKRKNHSLIKSPDKQKKKTIHFFFLFYLESSSLRSAILCLSECVSLDVL